VSVLEDIGTHLDKFLATVPAQWLAPFVGGAALSLACEEQCVVVGGGEAVGLPLDHALERVGVT